MINVEIFSILLDLVVIPRDCVSERRKRQNKHRRTERADTAMQAQCLELRGQTVEWHIVVLLHCFDSIRGRNVLHVGRAKRPT